MGQNIFEKFDSVRHLWQIYSARYSEAFTPQSGEGSTFLLGCLSTRHFLSFVLTSWSGGLLVHNYSEEELFLYPTFWQRMISLPPISHEDKRTISTTFYYRAVFVENQFMILWVAPNQYLYFNIYLYPIGNITFLLHGYSLRHAT